MSWVALFYTTDNIKNLAKKTYKNKQKHKNKTLVTFEITKAKQRYKNPNNIEKVYTQLRFPYYSQLNKIKRGRKYCGVVLKSQNTSNTKAYGGKS